MTLASGAARISEPKGHQATVESSVVVLEVRSELDIDVQRTSKTTTLALLRSLPPNHVETMVRGFAFG
jgi:hypothetical protein